jgi:hypothetical protein
MHLPGGPPAAWQGPNRKKQKPNTVRPQLTSNRLTHRNSDTPKPASASFWSRWDKVVPWAALVELITPYYPEGKKGRPPFSLQTMLRTHFLQQWFTLSDPGMSAPIEY